MLNQEKITQIENALRANPLHSNVQIAKECEVSVQPVKRLRKELGLWSSRRVRHRNGKAEIYRVKRSDDVAVSDLLSNYGVSDEMLKRLHNLRYSVEGQEAWQLILDILEIVQ